MKANRSPSPAHSTTLDPLIIEHRDALLSLAKRHGLSNVRVFGSMARGDANADSDIDLLVELQPGVSGLALGGMLVDVEALLGRRADVLTVGFLPPGLRERVLQEAIPL